MFWPDGVNSIVINRGQNSDVCQKEIEKEIVKVTKNKVGGVSFRKKPIQVRTLRTDWIQNTTENGKTYSLNDLILAMAEAEDDIFRSDLFKTLIAGFWH